MSIYAFAGRALNSFGSPSAATSDALLDGERLHNRLLLSLREDAELRDLLLSAAAAGADDGSALYLLLPQSVTLDGVRMTRELLDTHLVLLHYKARSEPRPFTSLNGLYGTVLEDGSIAVNGRLRRAAEQDRALGGSVGGWEMRGRNGKVPQLESQIVVLRETTLQPSAWLPLKAPIGMLLISDPLFFPGCGWKLPLALRRVTHRFESTSIDEMPLADLPQLLDEYQVLARSWMSLELSGELDGASIREHVRATRVDGVAASSSSANSNGNGNGGASDGEEEIQADVGGDASGGSPSTLLRGLLRKPSCTNGAVSTPERPGDDRLADDSPMNHASTPETPHAPSPAADQEATLAPDDPLRTARQSSLNFGSEGAVPKLPYAPGVPAAVVDVVRQRLERQLDRDRAGAPGAEAPATPPSSVKGSSATGADRAADAEQGDTAAADVTDFW